MNLVVKCIGVSSARVVSSV